MAPGKVGSRGKQKGGPTELFREKPPKLTGKGKISRTALKLFTQGERFDCPINLFFRNRKVLRFASHWLSLKGLYFRTNPDIVGGHHPISREHRSV